jgi:hypothetical protein
MRLKFLYYPPQRKMLPGTDQFFPLQKRPVLQHTAPKLTIFYSQNGRCGGGGEQEGEERRGEGDLRASGRFESVQRRKNRNLYTTAATFAGTASKARATGFGRGGKKEPRGRKPEAPCSAHPTWQIWAVGSGDRRVERAEGGAPCGSNRMRLLSRS